MLVPALAVLVATLAVALGVLLGRAARQRALAAEADERVRHVLARVDRSTAALRHAAALASQPEAPETDDPKPPAPDSVERRPTGPRRRTRRTPTAPPARP